MVFWTTCRIREAPANELPPTLRSVLPAAVAASRTDELRQRSSESGSEILSPLSAPTLLGRPNSVHERRISDVLGLHSTPHVPHRSAVSPSPQRHHRRHASRPHSQSVQFGKGRRTSHVIVTPSARGAHSTYLSSLVVVCLRLTYLHVPHACQLSTTAVYRAQAPACVLPHPMYVHMQLHATGRCIWHSLAV